MKRRDFLKSTVAGGVGLTTALPLSAERDMPMRTLGTSPSSSINSHLTRKNSGSF